VLDEMLNDKDTLITFSDAGAHIRNMAFYNLPLRFLQRVLQSHERGKPIMSIERAVHRLTGEQADWFGVPLGTIREGDRADLLLLDPDAFDQNLEAVSWAEMQNFELQRLVNRNPGLVPLVMINGKIACEDGAVSEALGRDKGFGEFIPARR
jgi:N-acyl-D-aspartate/D-glutamate deacylase